MRRTEPHRLSGCVSLIMAVLMATGSCSQETWESAMLAGQRAMEEGDYPRAERIFAAALVKTRRFEKDDLRVALTQTSLAQAYQGQRKFVEAEPLYTQALALVQKVRGPQHPDVAAILNNLGVLHRMHGQYPEAEDYLTRALSIKEGARGPSHPDVALTLTNLAQLWTAKRDYRAAERFYTRALRIREHAYGSSDPRVAQTLEDYASLLLKMKRDKEAELLRQRARTIRAKTPDEG